MSDFAITKATPEEAKNTDKQLTDFINKQLPFTQKHEQVFLNYVIKHDGKVIAGINADLYYWGILYISELFVSEEYRGQHLGSQLLLHIENEARELGGTLCQCDTFDLGANEFYQRHGYSIFGVLEDCPPGYQRFYLSKKL